MIKSNCLLHKAILLVKHWFDWACGFFHFIHDLSKGVKTVPLMLSITIHFMWVLKRLKHTSKRLDAGGFHNTPEVPLSLHKPEREFKAFRFLTLVLTSKPDDSVLMTDLLTLSKANSIIMWMRTEWLQLLKSFASPLVWSLVTKIRENLIQFTSSLPFRLTRPPKLATEMSLKEELFPMDTAGMYTQSWESRAQKRQCKRSSVDFFMCSMHGSVLILNFYQMPYGITTLWWHIFVAATIIHKGTEFK